MAKSSLLDRDLHVDRNACASPSDFTSNNKIADG